MDENTTHNKEQTPRLSRTETAHLYDILARWYDLLAGSWEKNMRLEAIGRLNLQPGDTVLEIGTGTGEALFPLVNRITPSGKVITVDLSSKMLIQARRKTERDRLSQDILLVRGDAVHLPIGCARVDAVFLCFTLELFTGTETSAVLEECKRVLKPSGSLMLLSLSDHGSPTMMKSIYIWFHRRFPRWIDCRPIPVRQSVQASGFQVVSCTQKYLWGLPVEILKAQKKGEIEVVYG